MHVVMYTFRTVRIVSSFKDLGVPIFILGQLKQDMALLLSSIKEKQPDLILGVGNGDSTCYEKVAQNNFHGRPIEQNGPASYSLFIPPTQLPTGKQVTGSFCNWSVYTIAHLIDSQHLHSRLSFLHIDKHKPEAVVTELARILV